MFAMPPISPKTIEECFRCEWSRLIRGRSLLCLLPVWAALFLAGCGEGDTTGPETQDKIVLFGYLYVNETISDENALFLSRTMPVLETYQVEDAVIAGATITLLKEGAENPDTLRMVRPGYYSNPDVTIEPITIYHLTVEIEGEDPVTAITTTPYPFEVLREPLEMPEVMVYSTIADLFPIYITCEQEDQIFVVDAYCLEEWEDAEYIVPFGDQDRPNDYEQYGGDYEEPRHINPYFRVKDLEQEDDAYRIGWYGDLFVFYGEYDIQVLSIDDNYYNYLYRDHPELYGGVQGGIGVFGSTCRAKWHVKAVE